MGTLRIRSRLILAFGIMVFLTMTLGGLSLLQMYNLAHLNEQLYTHPLAVSNAARDVKADVYAMHRSMKDVALADTEEDIRQEVAVADSFEQDALQRFALIQERYLGDPADVARAHDLLLAWRPIREEVVALMLAGRAAEAATITRGEGADHVAKLYEAVQSLENFAQSKADEFHGGVVQARQRARFNMALFLGLTVLCGAILALWITRGITHPLAVVVKAIKLIAQGDTRHTINVSGKDELAELAQSFREVQQGLRQKVEVAERISRGDFSNNITVRGESDYLGQAFHDMALALRNYTAEILEKNQALKEQAEELERVSASKSQFLANMSHEVRTPINGIMGMLQLLQTSELDPEQQEFARMAVTSCRRLTRLLGDILDISRIEAGVLNIIPEPFNLDPVLEELDGLFRIPAQMQHIELTITRDPGIPERLVGDSNRIRQVLFNLVGNAVKFTTQGGVHVHVSALPESLPGQVRILFAVEDTGPGIPDNLVDSIFQPFVQADDSLRRGFQGAGLGLPIVKRLTELMDGTLTLDNTEGGSVFFFSLPLALPMEIHPGTNLDVQAHEAAARHRILLVDDDDVGRMAVARLLDRQGHSIEVATQGEEALAALKAQDFDCVFMDIQMPVLDGLEATKIIRCSPEFKEKAHIPIVALTAYAMATDRARFLDAGMNEYLPKPVEAEALSQVLTKVMVNHVEPTGSPC